MADCIPWNDTRERPNVARRHKNCIAALAARMAKGNSGSPAGQSPRGLTGTLLAGEQLLRQVCAEAEFLDGMELGLKEVRMAFFVVQQALEEVLGAGVA